MSIALMGGSGSATAVAAPAGGVASAASSISGANGRFGWVTVGATSIEAVTLTNPFNVPAFVGSVELTSGTGVFDIVDDGTCRNAQGDETQVAGGASCTIDVRFSPTSFGNQTGATAADFVSLDSGDDEEVQVPVSGVGSEGFYAVTRQGEADPSQTESDPNGPTSAGSLYPSYAAQPSLNEPIVGAVTTPDGGGLWETASDGGIFALGDATYYGSTGNLTLNRPIVGMAATPDGHGYWLVASDGGIFAYGDATFYGSTGNLTLNKPIVGMAATPDGHGYWLVASDGGIFAYGDATFYGSPAGDPPPTPVVGVVPTPSGQGYWIISSGSFHPALGATADNYGDAPAANFSFERPYVAVTPDAATLS
jgi:hypothetical protein